MQADRVVRVRQNPVERRLPADCACSGAQISDNTNT